jgi:DNA adenine methylase
LINTFVVVRDKVDELIPLLREHRDKDNNREYFNEQRHRFNTMKGGLEKAAIFIYLNKTCFNGLYRVNSEGKFNVPFGKYKKPAILQEDKLRKASELLQGTELAVANFTEALNQAKKEDFIYLDPPYFPLTKTASFTSYQKGDFLEKEQKQLAQSFRELDKKGCFLMLSNSDTPFIRQLYEEFNIVTVKARRAINCIGTKRGKINEIVITNY